MNKRMRSMIFYIVLLLVATSGVSAFVILITQGESIQKWVPALLFSLIFAVVAIAGIRDCWIQE